VETPLKGAYLVQPEFIEDERGYFARTFCRREFAELGLNPDIAQCSISYNQKIGTLRGLHYQYPPDTEAKLVRCLAGKVFDVIVDLRPESPTFAQWHSAELSAESGDAFYAPEGFAHGFQTLTEGAVILYHMSAFYKASAATGIRFDDPRLAIQWPHANPTVSARDRELPLLQEAFRVQ
jgi:dTDP-4-dehydrorhamnose 3,5-epimerase